MNRHQRRKTRAGTGSQADVIHGFLNGTVLHNPPDVPTVGVGPLVWDISPGDGRRWYFVCASADRDDAFHLDCLKLADDDRDRAEQIRMGLVMELLSRRPIVVHHFDAEEPFAAFCAAMWPSERTNRLYADIKADYAERTDA